MSKGLSRRIDRIERRLKPEKGEWLKFPDGKGGYIEVPGCRTVTDVLALADASRMKNAEVDESERK